MAKVEAVVVPAVHEYVFTLSEAEAVALRTLIGALASYGGGNIGPHLENIWKAIVAEKRLYALGTMMMTHEQIKRAGDRYLAFLPGRYTPNKQESATE